MQDRFADSEHLYTGPMFEPRCPPVAAAPLAERAAYWLGTAGVWLALPVTLPAVFYFARRIRKNGSLRT